MAEKKEFSGVSSLVVASLTGGKALLNVPVQMPASTKASSKVDAVEHYAKALWGSSEEFRTACDSLDNAEAFTGEWKGDRLLAAIMVKQAAEEANDITLKDDKPTAVRRMLSWALRRHDLGRTQLLAKRAFALANPVGQ